MRNVLIVDRSFDFNFFYQRSQAGAEDNPGLGGSFPLLANAGDGFVNFVK